MDKSDAGLIGGGLAGIIASTVVLGLGPLGAAAVTLGSAYVGHEVASLKYAPKYQ